MRMVLGFALSILTTLAACGDDIEGETLVGATCSTAEDCDVTGVCVVGNGGLCSLECQSAGEPQQCPLGNYCDEQTVETSDKTVQKMLLCFPACRVSADCRDGFGCVGVKKGSGKVCVPKEDQRDE
jgi:hypothetical protein